MYMCELNEDEYIYTMGQLCVALMQHGHDDTLVESMRLAEASKVSSVLDVIADIEKEGAIK